MFRTSLRKFLRKEAIPYYNAWEQDGIIPRSFWRKMGEHGFLCPFVEEKYGGLNTDFIYSTVLIEELERVGAGLTGIGLHNDIVVPYLSSYGTDEQKQMWLPKCVTAETITAIAMTEPSAGSDLANIKATAYREGDYYIVNGEKTFITNGIHSDLVIVVCKTNPQANPPHKGISLLVLEREMKGFTRGKKLQKIGMHSQDTAELLFDNVKVPHTHLLGQENMGFYYLMDKLQQERFVVAISAVTAAQSMLELTMKYTREREVFGSSISKLQTVQFRLAEMHTEITIGQTFVYELVKRHVKGERIVSEVSMAKWWTTEMAKRIATECLQLHGGYGYMEEYEIARRYRDIPVTSIYAGSNEIMKTIIAKQLSL
ncbi:acyl-CoA dehydrogenase family protein [Priestia taiwanensis]|nr:acyl-CoA dehydrogenase family protein [Priestia taiwanensis]